MGQVEGSSGMVEGNAVLSKTTFLEKEYTAPEDYIHLLTVGHWINTPLEKPKN